MTAGRGISFRETAGLLNGHTPIFSSFCRRFYSKSIIQENDVVLLRQKSNSKAAPILTKPLQSGGKVFTVRDAISTDDIIGKGVRDLVRTKKGIEYRIYEPSLAEYTDLSPRLVTPIYSQDANLIVSLLDLHVGTPDAHNGAGPNRFELFEAGTGHGALTLNLARAIHGANTTAPAIPPQRGPTISSSETDTGSLNLGLEAKAMREAYSAWRVKRRAVIHTLDKSAPYSAHAQGILRNFRQGIYYPHVDFHVGTIEEFLSERLAANPEPFLDHAILDLPNTRDYVEIVGKSLKPNGLLITWSPSITQINKCVHLVKDRTLPFLLEKVLELGAGIGVGGREWDVRLVKPRTLLKVTSDLHKPNSEEEHTPEALAEISVQVDVPKDLDVPDAGWEMVCRPKVGVRVEGGGFIGLWRRMEMY